VDAKRVLSIAVVLLALVQRASADGGLSLANTSQSLGNGKWQWTAFVKAAPDVLHRVVCVQYNLDPTFPDPSRLVCEQGSENQAFRLTDTAWGDFSLSATVILNDRSTQKLALVVKLQGGTPTERPGTALQVKAVSRSGVPIPNASVLVVSPDGRYWGGLSGQDGGLRLEFFDQARPTVFCARTGFAGSFRLDADPSQLTLFELRPSAGGSIIIENGTGYVPGLEGRLNPILDTLQRSYIYADNVAIEGNSAQPFPFTLGRPFRVVDARGRAFSLAIIAMRGRSFLINYSPSQ